MHFGQLATEPFCPTRAAVMLLSSQQSQGRTGLQAPALALYSLLLCTRCWEHLLTPVLGSLLAVQRHW